MFFHSAKRIIYLVVFLLIETILISCVVPTVQSGIGIGDADFGDTSANVGSNPHLSAPQNLTVLNNKTTKDTFLELKWDPVDKAGGYAVYRAVYPTSVQTHLEDKNFKFFAVVKGSQTTSYKYEIPGIPLRRYVFRVTALNKDGESHFSQSADGWRLPVDAEEALRDIDYTIHFAQSQVKGFGSAGKKVTLKGRGSGVYVYNTPIFGRLQSSFSSYADFETVLNGSPQMQVTTSPLGMKMNGDIQVTGLYNATLTYIDLQGVTGGLTKGGKIKISYQNPNLSKPDEKEYTYQQAKSLMRSVAETEAEKAPAPPRSEWDESSPSFTRAIRYF